MKVRRALGYIQVASLRSANPSARQNQTNRKTEQISLHEKNIIEEAKVQYELSKEDIYNLFKFAVKAGTEFCYDLFIHFVKVYNHKIEIGLNYGLNQVDNDREQIIRKVSTETHEITRLFKGGTVKTKHYNYDIYVVI